VPSPSAMWRDEGCITGIDHAAVVTANAEENMAFYQGVLGLELCRNSSTGCEDHGHLSYRQPNTQGRPFLHFIIKEQAMRGESCAGSVKRLGLPVASHGRYEDALSYWCDRLDAARVRFDYNGDNPMLWFKDPDGLGLKIDVSYGRRDPKGPIAFEANQPIPPDYELTGINGVRFFSPDRSASAYVMRHVFGCALHDQREVWWAKRIFNHCGGAFVGWEKPLETPTGEAGSVHHVALSCPRPDELHSDHVPVAWGRR
jgi:catechol 2,3-dioxygenase-like lactoylglutathione lyase family enzyme